MNKYKMSKHRKLISPKWRLAGGILVLITAVASLFILLITSTLRPEYIFATGIWFVMGLKYVISHENYQEQYNKTYNFQPLAKPVSEDGSEEKAHRFYIYSANEHPKYVESDIEKFITYLVFLLFFLFVGFEFINIGGGSVKQFINAQPHAPGLAFSLMLGVTYRYILGKKIGIFKKNRRLIFILSVFCLWGLYSAIEFIYLTDHTSYYLISAIPVVFILIALTTRRKTPRRRVKKLSNRKVKVTFNRNGMGGDSK